MTRIYFDMEFTGLHQGTSMISLGMVSDDGRYFYAECLDYDGSQVNDWLRENVLSKLRFSGKKYYSKEAHGKFPIDQHFSMNVCDKRSEVAYYLVMWLEQFGGVEMYGDVLAYDWVLFCEMFGGAFNIPKSVYYIPQDLASYLKRAGEDPDVNRFEFGGVDLKAHNALSDALAVKGCFDRLAGYKRKR